MSRFPLQCLVLGLAVWMASQWAVAQQPLAIKPLAERKVAELPSGELYWRIDNFDSLAEAKAAAGPWSLVAESAGKVWLFTLGARGKFFRKCDQDCRSRANSARRRYPIPVAYQRSQRPTRQRDRGTQSPRLGGVLRAGWGAKHSRRARYDARKGRAGRGGSRGRKRNASVQQRDGRLARAGYVRRRRRQAILLAGQHSVDNMGQGSKAANIPVPFLGGCACGAIRYECVAAPLRMVNCHCRDCQRASGSGYSATIIMSAASVRMLSGKCKEHQTLVENGNFAKRAFCGDCGTPLFAASSARPEFLGVKAASLDDAGWFAPEADVWIDSAQPWDHMDPDIPKFSRNRPRPSSA